MKLARFQVQGRTACGIIDGEEVTELESDFFGNLKTLSIRHTIAGVRLMSPCSPSKVVAVGLNYRDHAQEMGIPVPDMPIIFLKPATTVIGPGEIIRYPGMSSQVDYEAELGIVIKDTVKDLIPEEARRHILGYTCANDVTARDLQKKTANGRVPSHLTRSARSALDRDRARTR
jgi:2-keto-4-pentenoate hydratase/2-oxohepta-3-ene-1,7-dioic acid hydratase in catechol pathway